MMAMKRPFDTCGVPSAALAVKSSDPSTIATSGLMNLRELMSTVSWVPAKAPVNRLAYRVSISLRPRVITLPYPV